MKLIEWVVVIMIVSIIFLWGLGAFEVMYYKFNRYFLNQKSFYTDLVNYSNVLVERDDIDKQGYVYFDTWKDLFGTSNTQTGAKYWKYECFNKSNYKLIWSQQDINGKFCEIDYNWEKIFNFKIKD